MADYKISVDLDNLTLGDLEDMESKNFTKILRVLEHVVRVEGTADEDQPQAVRALPFRALSEIVESIKEAVDAEVDQEIDEKN